MATEPIAVHLELTLSIVDRALLEAVAPPVMRTPDGGLTAPSDDMRVASVLGSLLLGLADGLEAQAGIRILEMDAVDVGRTSSEADEAG
jgi:hypothetical protein